MQSLGIEWRTVVVETSAELGCEVLRISSTASIAAEMNLSAVFQTFDTHRSGIVDSFDKSFIIENKLVSNVKLLGFQRNVHEYLKQCDFGVQPSTIAEVQGISNLEYMKHGKPIITTNNGAQPEYVVDKENGLLVKPNNSEQLAEAILLLCNDKELRLKLGAQAKQDFDSKLNYNTFYNKITTLYNNLLA